MAQSDPLSRIKQRRLAIAKRNARLDRLLAFIGPERARLDQEDRKLAAVEETLVRLAGVNDDDLLLDFPSITEGVAVTPQDEEESATEADAEDTSIPRVGTARPANIPTTPQMFDLLLAEAENAGKPGLRGRDLVVGIRSKWWSGAGWNSILPTAFALAAKGRLGRQGKLFVRVRRAQPNAAQVAARH